MAALPTASLAGTVQSHLDAQTCVCRGARFRRYKRELGLLVAEPDARLSAVLARRHCREAPWPAASRNDTLHGAGDCIVGRLFELVLCSQARLLRRDLPGMLRFRTRANALMPFALPCLAADDWPVSAEELHDNFVNAVRVLGEHVAPDEEEKQGFFKKALSQEAWAQRVGGKAAELANELRWRSLGDERSEAAKLRHPASYSSAAPAGPPAAGEDADAPCGLAEPAGRGAEGARPAPQGLRSRARPLSSSGCVWLLENACVEDRSIVLFGDRKERLPRTLMGCGEFGNYDFTSVEVRKPHLRRLLPNATEVGAPETLLVVPGLMSGVSLHNPFHLLHSTVPLAWQLHHPSYGLCVPRDGLDVRLAFFNAFHGKRSAHFWRVFTNPRKAPISGEDLEQRFNIAATWRFWWGPLASRLPMPFGADVGPRCYRRIVFGRELFRTGLGGFGTPRVMAFYHRYLAGALRGQAFHRRPAPSPSSEPLSDDAEWPIFERMGPTAPHEDFTSLWEFERKYATPFFTPEGAQRIRLPPFRMWKAEGSLATTSAGGPMPFRGPAARVEPRLVHSRDAGLRQQLRLLLVQRPKGAGRWIANIDDVVRWTEAWRHPRVSLALLIADLGEMHPAAQWQLASQTHILVGVTGAALAWAAFLPRGGVVLDVFPPASHFCTEGWDRNPVSHYGGLSRLAGVQHACMVHPAELQGPPREGVSPEQQAMLEVREKLGGLWHGQDVRLDMPKFQRFFDEGVERALAALSSL